MLIGLWPNSWNSSLSTATVAAASAISTPFQSKTTSLIILFKIFDCVPEYLQPWPFLRHRLAFPNVRFAKVRPMRHLREAHSTLGMRHESQDATIVRSDTCDVFQRPVGIGWHLEMFCRFPLYILERNCPVFFESSQHLRRSIVFAFPMCYWDGQSLYSLQPWALSCDLQINPTT